MNVFVSEKSVHLVGENGGRDKTAAGRKQISAVPAESFRHAEVPQGDQAQLGKFFFCYNCQIHKL
jgi:hypothetical protein